MSWNSLINIGIGILLGYGIFLGQSARRRLRGSEDEAMRMYATSLHSLSERMGQLARTTGEQSSESDEEMMFRMGQSKAFEAVAEELRGMAAKVAG